VGSGPKEIDVGFMAEQVALGNTFSEYFGLCCHISFHQCSIVIRMSSRWWKIGPLEATVTRYLFTPPHKNGNCRMVLLIILSKYGYFSYSYCTVLIIQQRKLLNYREIIQRIVIST